jgi:PII-like signaling protein
MKIPEDGALLRIFLGESDRWNSKPAYEAIVLAARQAHLAGATVYHGVMGFGAKSRLHTAKILRLSEDLPVVIEIVDSMEKIEAFIVQIDQIVNDGLITIEPVRVIKYRADPPQ